MAPRRAVALLALLALAELLIGVANAATVCPYAGWAVFTDTTRVEGRHSCFTLISTQASFTTANSSCPNGTRLLTTAATSLGANSSLELLGVVGLQAGG